MPAKTSRSSASSRPRSARSASTGGGSGSATSPPSRVPTLASLQGQSCSRCGVGVLQVISYDPEALHERGQVIEGGKIRSGGAYVVDCQACGLRESRALNPTDVDLRTEISVAG